MVSDEHPDRDAHDNASRLLVELLKVSRDAAYASQDVPASERCDDPLLAVIESPSTVSLILDTMFKVNNQHRVKFSKHYSCPLVRKRKVQHD